MPGQKFSQRGVPGFDAAPSVILIFGPLDFFVEEAAETARGRLSEGGETEVLRFEAEAPSEAISDALLNRSLFSPRRVVQFDVSRLLGTASPGRLLTAALEGWRRGGPGGRREAFRQARALLSALDLSPREKPEETAESVARRLKRPNEAAELADILRELPDERGEPSLLAPALRRLLERGNDGTVALVTAVAPPAGVELLAEIGKKGLVLEVAVGEKDLGPALARLAQAKAREREIRMEPAAVSMLLQRTDAQPELFAAELEKLFQLAGEGGVVAAADVGANVEDEASENLYAFYDAIGRRDAAETLTRLDRLFSAGRVVREGDREVDTESYWPVVFLSRLTSEVRRMLLVRARLEEIPGGLDGLRSYRTFQSQVMPHLEEPLSPFGRSPFGKRDGRISPYLWFKAAERASRYETKELVRALARSADVDVALKTSVPPLPALTAYVAELIAGKR